MSEPLSTASIVRANTVVGADALSSFAATASSSIDSNAAPADTPNLRKCFQRRRVVRFHAGNDRVGAPDCGDKFTTTQAPSKAVFMDGESGIEKRPPGTVVKHKTLHLVTEIGERRCGG